MSNSVTSKMTPIIKTRDFMKRITVKVICSKAELVNIVSIYFAIII